MGSGDADRAVPASMIAATNLQVKAAEAMEPVVLRYLKTFGEGGASMLFGLARALELPEVRHFVLATLTDNEIEAALRNRIREEETH